MRMTKVAMAVALVFDPIRTTPWDYAVEATLLAEHGVELRVPEDAIQAVEWLAEADVLVVSSRLPSDLLVRLQRCVGILCYSVGMDGVDLEAAEALGIPVANVPGYCTEEVSDHALALLYAAQREIVPLATAAAAGRWAVHREPALSRIRRMSALVVGVVGFGRIGRRVAEKCLALGMSVLVHDPNLAATGRDDVPLVPFDHLLANSDAIILCASLTPASRHLIDEEALRLMRSDTIVVNVARGDLVDERALAEALREGRLRGAALDVRAVEPPLADDPISGLSNVILTQHIGARSQEAHADLHRMAAQRILELLGTRGSPDA